MKKGFTLIEILVGTAVFLIVAFSAYQAYISLFNLVNLNQYKIMGLNLANERFEIVRNLSYIDIGEISGVPNGIVPHVETFVRGGITFIATTTIRNIDLPFDGTIGGTPDDLSPADNKLVEVEVGCPSCKNFTPVILTTTVAPKNLETASTNGALFIKVFDANGQPVSDANVHIVNITVTPNINIDDITDANGMLRIIDAPPAIQSYAISVSKSGYSSARTYPPGDAGNPDPTQPDATVILQQVTQVSLSIDKISSVHFSSMN
ncbi:MAG TPA: prepilin-type N-terminal cleavage/methylation domain-containing protein, partial [Candidatus Paceibacterota bacterium]